MQYKQKMVMPLLMWVLPLAFFTYQFILRLWPSLTMQQIMTQFAVDATAYGFLASAYYWGYAGMQIPLAILLDRWGARMVVFVCALLCGLAMFVFVSSTHWSLLVISRFMIGVGSAVGFLAVSKVISQWFKKDHYARMVGFTFTIGLMGAIYGGKPTSLLIEKAGIYDVGVMLACISVAIGFGCFFFLRTPSRAMQDQHVEDPIRGEDLKNLLSSPIIWLLGIANLLMVGSLEGFADVWGVNYLTQAYGVTKSEAASLTSFIFYGMLFGGPLLAFISRYLGYYLVITLCGFGMAIALSSLVFGFDEYHYHSLAALFLGIGILCCYQVIVFAVGCDLVEARLLGVTIAFLNSINMFGGSFFHALIGYMMDRYWTGEMMENMRLYTLVSYNHALMVIPFCAVIGALLVALVSAVTKRRTRHALAL